MAANKVSNALVIIPLAVAVDFESLFVRATLKAGSYIDSSDDSFRNLMNSAVSDFPVSLKSLSSTDSRQHIIPFENKTIGTYRVVAYEIVVPNEDVLKLNPLLLIRLEGSLKSGISSLEQIIPLGKVAGETLGNLGIDPSQVDMNGRAIALSNAPSRRVSSDVMNLPNVESRKFLTTITEFAIIFMYQDLVTIRLRSLVPMYLGDRKVNARFIEEATITRTRLWWRQIAASGVQKQLMEEFDERFDQYNQMTEILRLADEIQEYEKLILSQTLNKLGFVATASGLIAAWSAIGINNLTAGLVGGVVTLVAGTGLYLWSK